MYPAPQILEIRLKIIIIIIVITQTINRNQDVTENEISLQRMKKSKNYHPTSNGLSLFII